MTAALRIAPPGKRIDGRLVSAQWIRDEIFGGGEDAPSIEWILSNVPGKKRLGHRTVRWNENDVRVWASNRR